MEIEEAIYSYLTDATLASGVYQLAGRRGYPMVIPQTAERPCWAAQRISDTEFVNHDGTAPLAMDRLQFTCQASSYEGAKELVRAIQDALRGYHGAMSSVTVESILILNEFDGYGMASDIFTVRTDMQVMHRATTPRPANTWYVSPNGSATGTGSKDSPIDILTMIGTSSPARPGDTIYLRGGVYTPLTAGSVVGADATNGTAVAGKGVYTLKIKGTNANQITICNYPGEVVKINGAIHASTGQASYLTIRGLEIYATPTTRVFANRPAVDFPGIYVSAPGMTFDRCYIHDITEMFVMGTGGFTFTQNIIGLCGMYLTSEGWTGYCIYTHNNPGGTMTFKKNIFLGSYNGYNLGCHSGGANGIKDYDVQYNTFFAGGPLWGSASGVDSNNVFSHNYLYTPVRSSTPINIATYNMRSRAYDNANSGENWTVQNNLWWNKRIGDVPFYQKARMIDFSNNTIIDVSGVFALINLSDYALTITHDNNTYRATSTSLVFTHPDYGTGINLATWQAASGWDASSTFTQALPTANTVTVLPDDNYNGRGIITVFNYLGSTSVTVDLTTLNITDGARCRYYNALNRSEYVDFIYDADSPNLTISMLAASWSILEPTAQDTSRSWSIEPFPDFGVFQVEMIEEPATSSGEIEEAIYAHLIADGAVYELAGKRVYPMVVPQEATLPALAYQQLGMEEITDHDGYSKLITARFQLTCVGESFWQARDLSQRVLVSLRGFRGQMGSGSVVDESIMVNQLDGYGTESKKYTAMVDMRFIYRS